MKLNQSLLDQIEQARSEGRVAEGPRTHFDGTAIKMAPMPPDVSEDEFSDRVVSYAQDRLWRVAHFRPAKTSKGWRTAVSANGKGFPDGVFVRERIVYAELKSINGVLTKEQKEWRDAIIRAGGEWYEWRPADWQEIERILR